MTAAAYAPRVRPRSERIELRGLSHRVLHWGEPSADPVVLLHGFLDAAATWQFLVDELPREGYYVGLDWRGFGESAWAPRGYWFPEYLADLEEFLEQLSPQRPVRLVGHSMGGNLVALFRGIRAERVEWSVNLEGFGLPRTHPREAPQRYCRWLDETRRTPRETSYANLDVLAQRLIERNPRLRPDRAAFIAASWSRPRGSRYTLAGDPRHREVNPVLYQRDEAAECWKLGRSPMLLLNGELSEFRARLGADATDEALHEVFANTTIVTVPGAGHMMHHEEPEFVAQAMRRFVSGLAQ